MSVIRPGDGMTYAIGFLPGYRSEFVVSDHESEQRVAAAVEDVPAGMPHGRHVHRERDEVFFVIFGELEFTLGDRREVVGAGATVFAPRGVAHSFANPHDADAKMLALWVPGGIEGMYQEWQSAFPAGAAFDPGRFVEIWRRYDTEPVD